MTRTEYQKAGFTATNGEAGSPTGVALYATHTPTYLPPTTSQYPYSPTSKSAGPTHRTAIIGITGLALLLAAMAGIAYVRYQDTATPTVTTIQAVQPIPRSVYESQVPAAARITVPASVVAQQVPHAAAAALRADSVYAEQVPAAARVTIPRSTYDSQVPEAAR